jgi:hypothetical protein
MKEDPIVEEVRKIREENAARFSFDINKIVADAQRRQTLSGRRIVSFERGTKASVGREPTSR